MTNHFAKPSERIVSRSCSYSGPGGPSFSLGSQIAQSTGSRQTSVHLLKVCWVLVSSHGQDLDFEQDNGGKRLSWDANA